MTYYPPYPHPYQKLGGLLKFYVVMAPISLCFTVIGQFSPTGFWRAWPTYEGARFWLQLTIQLCLMYSTVINLTWAVMILRRDPRFVRTWQLAYIGSIASAAARWPLYLIYGYPEGTSLASNIVITIGLPVSFCLWTLYYIKSVRVRTYMGSDKYLRLAFFTRKARGPEPAVPDGA